MHARCRARTSDGVWRAVVWNYGWDLFRAGDDKAALEQWRSLLSSRGVTASWMPPTFALVLWSLDRKDEAVQWYGAAVRSEPQQWRTADQFARLLPAWSDTERARSPKCRPPGRPTRRPGPESHPVT